MGRSKDIASGTFTTALDVQGAITSDGLTVDTSDQVIINHSGDAGGLRIDSTNNTNTGSIRFGDVADNYIGAVEYNHTTDALSFYANNATHMTIDSSGRVTTPNQPAWRIGRGSSYTITNGQAANSVINFNVTNDTTRRFFTQGGITVSSGVVTVPVTGVYNVGATIRLDGVGGGYAIVAIRINNDSVSTTGTYNIKGPSGFSSSYQTWSESTVFKLNANDQVKVYYYVQTDTNFDVNSRSYFHGYLLG